jgi:hypothetical protein
MSVNALACAGKRAILSDLGLTTSMLQLWGFQMNIG